MAKTVFDGGGQMYRQLIAEEARREVGLLQTENEQLRSALEALLALTAGSRHAGGEDDCRVCAAIVAAEAALVWHMED